MNFNPKCIARTLITVLAVTLLFCALSFIPSIENLAYNTFIEFIGEIDIFKNWFTVLTEYSQSSEFSSILHLGSTVRLLFYGYLYVLSKSFFTYIIIATSKSALKNYISGWPLLSTIIGIIIGIAFTSFLSNTKGNASLLALANVLSTIVVICIGIVIVLHGKMKLGGGMPYSESRSKIITFFLVDILWETIVSLTSTLYISTLSFTISGIVPITMLIIVTLIFIAILILDYLESIINDKNKMRKKFKFN